MKLSVYINVMLLWHPRTKPCIVDSCHTRYLLSCIPWPFLNDSINIDYSFELFYDILYAAIMRMHSAYLYSWSKLPTCSQQWTRKVLLTKDGNAHSQCLITISLNYELLLRNIKQNGIMTTLLNILSNKASHDYSVTPKNKQLNVNILNAKVYKGTKALLHVGIRTDSQTKHQTTIQLFQKRS